MYLPEVSGNSFLLIIIKNTSVPLKRMCMAADYHYPGEELQLFAEAGNWKRYLSRHISPFIKGNVLEVGAGLGETTPYLINDQVNAWTCLEPDEQQGIAIREKILTRKLPTLTTVIQGNLDEVSGKVFDT